MSYQYYLCKSYKACYTGQLLINSNKGHHNCPIWTQYLSYQTIFAPTKELLDHICEDALAPMLCHTDHWPIPYYPEGWYVASTQSIVTPWDRCRTIGREIGCCFCTRYCSALVTCCCFWGWWDGIIFRTLKTTMNWGQRKQMRIYGWMN